jgi:hypothetical protein
VTPFDRAVCHSLPNYPSLGHGSFSIEMQNVQESGNGYGGHDYCNDGESIDSG